MLYKVEQIPLEKLRPSPFNPRKHFPKAELAELAASIQELGVIEPLIVRAASTPPDGHYEIIAGERRFRAAKLAGLVNVPCMQQDYADVRSRELQIAENLMRQGITPLEEAAGFEELLDAAKGLFNVERLAERIGKSKEYVYARLKLLKLAQPAKKALEAGEISASHAVELVPLKPEQQEEMVREITDEYNPITSVQDLRDTIKQNYEPRKAPVVSKAEAARRKKWKDDEAKRRVQQAARDKKWDAEEKRQELVDARAISALWPVLKGKASGSSQDYIKFICACELPGIEGIGPALAVAAGKTFHDGITYQPRAFIEKNLAKRPLYERLALWVLSLTIEGLRYDKKRSEATLRAAGIDRKKIPAQIAAETKAAAAKAAAEPGAAMARNFQAKKAALQASAKLAKHAKPRKPRTPRPTARRKKAKE